jgi:hypothetical protein
MQVEGAESEVRLWVFAGKQLVTAERIEVLALLADPSKSGARGTGQSSSGGWCFGCSTVGFWEVVVRAWAADSAVCSFDLHSSLSWGQWWALARPPRSEASLAGRRSWTSCPSWIGSTSPREAGRQDRTLRVLSASGDRQGKPGSVFASRSFQTRREPRFRRPDSIPLRVSFRSMEVANGAASPHG